MAGSKVLAGLTKPVDCLATYCLAAYCFAKAESQKKMKRLAGSLTEDRGAS